MAVIHSVIVSSVLMIICAVNATKYWVSHTEAQLLVPHELLGEPEEHASDVWKSCNCYTTYCSCNAEFHGWNNKMLYFNIVNEEQKFTMEVYDDALSNSQKLTLKNGMECRDLNAGIFGRFCIKTYGLIANPFWMNVCLQLGLVIERHHSVALEFQCFKADNSSFNHTGIKFESPPLRAFNMYMFKNHTTSSARRQAPTLIGSAVLLTLLLIINSL